MYTNGEDSGNQPVAHFRDWRRHIHRSWAMQSNHNERRDASHSTATLGKLNEHKRIAWSRECGIKLMVGCQLQPKFCTKEDSRRQEGHLRQICTKLCQSCNRRNYTHSRSVVPAVWTDVCCECYMAVGDQGKEAKDSDVWTRRFCIFGTNIRTDTEEMFSRSLPMKKVNDPREGIAFKVDTATDDVMMAADCAHERDMEHRTLFWVYNVGWIKIFDHSLKGVNVKTADAHGSVCGWPKKSEERRIYRQNNRDKIKFDYEREKHQTKWSTHRFYICWPA